MVNYWSTTGPGVQ